LGRTPAIVADRWLGEWNAFEGNYAVRERATHLAAVDLHERRYIFGQLGERGSEDQEQAGDDRKR
jgi:hypothetical protein